jgi:hypothetical protein
MSHPSVAVLILRLLSIGVRFCAGSAALILAIVLWEQTLSGANHEMSMTDYAFLAVVRESSRQPWRFRDRSTVKLAGPKTLTGDDAD